MVKISSNNGEVTTECKGARADVLLDIFCAIDSAFHALKRHGDEVEQGAGADFQKCMLDIMQERFAGKELGNYRFTIEATKIGGLDEN